MLKTFSNTEACFAPMVGVSHFAVRKALCEFVPPGLKVLWPTEMLSSRRLAYEKEGQTSELIFNDRDQGLCPQLLGNEEFYIRASVKKLEDWGAQAIDINMGCPAKQVLRHNYGVALMGDPDYAARVVDMTVRATKLPVSVKMRAGLQNDTDFLIKFCRGLENAGAQWITLHPRIAALGRKGSADWNQIKILKDSLKIAVIGNGDIECETDAIRMLQTTGCDRVMIGRALTAKPYLIATIAQKRGASVSQDFLPQSQFEEGAFYGRFLKRVVEISEEFYSEVDGLKKLCFLLYHSCVWLEFGHHLYGQIRGAKTYSDAQARLNTFFSQPHRMREKTILRH